MRLLQWAETISEEVFIEVAADYAVSTNAFVEAIVITSHL
jgi:hypothetical protein